MWDIELAEAINNNNSVEISRLMSNGSNPNQLNLRGNVSHLLNALRLEPKTSFNTIVNHQNFVFTQETALVVVEALATEQPHIAEMLLKKTINSKINMDLWLINGRTALWYAAGKGYTDVAKLLIKHGANPNHIEGDNTDTPLCVGITNQEIVKILLESLRFQFNWGAIYAIKEAIAVNELTSAIAIISKRTVQSSRLDSVLFAGKTILMIALEYYALAAEYEAIAAKQDATQVIIQLLDHGANPQYQTSSSSLSPLSYAVDKELKDIVDLFISHAEFRFTPQTIQAVNIALAKSSTEYLTILLKNHKRYGPTERSLSDIEFARYMTQKRYIDKLKAAESFCQNFMDTEAFTSENIAIIAPDGGIFSKQNYTDNQYLRGILSTDFAEYPTLSDYCLKPSLENLYILAKDPFTDKLMDNPCIIIIKDDSSLHIEVCDEKSFPILLEQKKLNPTSKSEQHPFKQLKNLIQLFKNDLEYHHQQDEPQNTDPILLTTPIPPLPSIPPSPSTSLSSLTIFSRIFDCISCCKKSNSTVEQGGMRKLKAN